SAQPCSPRSSWRSLLRQPAPFNGRSTIAVPAKTYRSRVDGSSRRGNFLPSACLFLQKGGNGSRTSGQHSCGPWKTKPFSESFCFVAATEPPALLEKRNHLARE